MAKLNLVQMDSFGADTIVDNLGNDNVEQNKFGFVKQKHIYSIQHIIIA